MTRAAKTPSRLVLAALSVVFTLCLAGFAAILTAVATFSDNGEEPSTFQCADNMFGKNLYEASLVTARQVRVSLVLEPDDITAVKGKGLVCFNLHENAAREGEISSADHLTSELDKSSEEVILAAAKDIESTGATMGFMLIDVYSGKGIAYKETKRVWTASSVKAPLCMYIASELIDSGKLSWDDDFRSGYQTRSGGLVVTGSTGVRKLIKQALVDSDNNSYVALFYGCDRKAYSSWLKGHGLTGKKANGTFPYLSALEMTKAWVVIRSCLQSDSDAMKTVGDWLTRTNFSPIRAAAKSVAADKSQLTVYNKAGWCDYINGGNSCCDNAWVIIDGREYLLSIMTNQSCSLDDKPGRGTTVKTDAAYKRMVKLATALLDARGSLQ